MSLEPVYRTENHMMSGEINAQGLVRKTRREAITFIESKMGIWRGRHHVLDSYRENGQVIAIVSVVMTILALFGLIIFREMVFSVKGSYASVHPFVSDALNVIVPVGSVGILAGVILGGIAAGRREEYMQKRLDLENAQKLVGEANSANELVLAQAKRSKEWGEEIILKRFHLFKENRTAS